MEREFHIRDSLFLVSLYIKSIQSALKLEASNDLIVGKLASDIDFISTALEKFHALLLENTTLVDRLECIQLLRVTMHSFAEILSYSVHPTQKAQSEVLHTIKPPEELKKIHDAQKEHLEVLRRIMQDSGALEEETRNTVSQTELEMLLHSSD